MIGERIKQARLACGLSQQQLAGPEMTRSFICRVEHGKVNPSPRTLQLLAGRLGKPVEYFTAGDALTAEIDRLLADSERALAAWRPAEALELAARAVAVSGELGQPVPDFAARLQQIKVHSKLEQYQEALALSEALLELYPTPPSPALLAEAWLCMGNCHLALENLGVARRYLERAHRQAAEPTDSKALAALTCVSLGACLFLLGETEQAVQALEAVLASDPPEGAGEAGGLARMNLGWVRYKQGDRQAGLALTLEALAILEAVDHASAVTVRHNLAVMEADRNRWDRAIELLQECLQAYTERGQVRLQAAALEELGRCFLVHGCLTEALEVCGQALALLDQEGDGLQRGRLYRLMATAHHAGGDVQRAHDLALVGLELFRRLGAGAEVSETLAFLAALHAPATAGSRPLVLGPTI